MSGHPPDGIVTVIGAGRGEEIDPGEACRFPGNPAVAKATEGAAAPGATAAFYTPETRADSGSDVLNYAIAFSSRRTSRICLLQPLDVELDHFQHCFGNALGARPIRILHHIAEHHGHDLPEEPIALFQPPTLLDLSAFRQRRPEPVNFGLIVALNHHHRLQDRRNPVRWPGSRGTVDGGGTVACHVAGSGTNGAIAESW